MVFSSYIFIFIFLPVVLVGYYLLAKIKNPIFQRLWLIAASLFFYGYYNVWYVAIICASIIVNYLVAYFMQEKADKQKLRKALFIIGIVFNVLLLGFFKYYDFLIENINALFGANFSLLNIVLTLGISFFTFQQLCFLTSVYGNEEKVGRFEDYCVFVLFFPQLVAGPIVLYGEMMPQFADESRRKFSSANFSQGLYIFCIGLFKKAVIADTIALFVSNGFGESSLGLLPAWVTALSYTFQIYFDFSGYSDMAIGLGKMFNIDIPANFLSPYKSESVTVFWRKWHITLGRALGKCVYIPLGGNRKGKVRTYINLFITFLVSGIWHGAAWTFILWGVLHGVFVVIERLLGKNLEKIPRVIRIIITFLIINALWVLFRAENFTQALTVYKGMINFGNLGFAQLKAIIQDGLINFPFVVDIAYLSTFLIGSGIIVWCCKNSYEKYKEFIPNNKALVFIIILFCISIVHLSRESIFIYFRF